MVKTNKTFEFNNDIVVYAFRYCLGRYTYAVGICIEFIINNWSVLQQKTKVLIHKEIKEHKDPITNPYHTLEHKCDSDGWDKVLALPINSKDDNNYTFHSSGF